LTQIPPNNSKYMTDTTFDPDAILSQSITQDEAEGRKPLTPEGTYNNCVIESITPYEPHEKQLEKGVEARLYIKFVCPDSDVDLGTYMNYKRPLHAKATYSKLLRAVWSDPKECASKQMDDLVGEHVNVSVFHEEGDFGKWAEFRFTPVG